MPLFCDKLVVTCDHVSISYIATHSPHKCDTYFKFSYKQKSFFF